jgi:hypothetical protein
LSPATSAQEVDQLGVMADGLVGGIASHIDHQARGGMRAKQLIKMLMDF